MDQKKAIIIFAAFALLAAGVFIFFFLQRGDDRLVASGTIEATEVTVSSKVSGRVVNVMVDEGDRVSEGDLLVKIETKELAAALKSAQAKYSLAKDDYERSRKLYADKMISPQQFETVRSAFEVASAGLEMARIQYENAQVNAPISGTILVKAIEKGELATVGTPLVTMADLSRVNLMVYLAEKDVGKVRLGEEVLVSVDSYPDEAFKGKVVYISDKAEFTPKAIQTRKERVTQVFGIKIRIPNPEEKLKPGMPADAEFQWNSQ